MKTATIAAVMLAVTVPAAWGQFGDGAYLVGVDVEPNIYRAPGGAFCTWERLSGLGGEFDDIIAMDVSENRNQLVEIKRSDTAFKVSGCGRWEPVGEVGVSVSGNTTAVLVMAILYGVKDVLEPGIGAVFEIKMRAAAFLRRVHDSGHLNDDEKETADFVLDAAFEDRWPPPQDDS